MTINKFIRKCITRGLEFSLGYYDIDSHDTYCLQMILGNVEHIIPVDNDSKLYDLWYNEIMMYWM